jgi:GNAT superfamily N-acetyltransferase
VELIEIAEMEEARQARGLAEVAPESRPFAGGTAGRGQPGQWINYAVGMGMAGPVDEAECDEIIAWYVERGVEPRFEVSPFVGDEFLRMLEKRGFGVRVFENVFYREIDRARRVEPVFATPREVEIGIVNPGDDAEIREYGAVAMSGFFPPGVSPTEANYEQVARGVKHPRSVAMVARVGGRIVGAGAMEVSGEAAGLFGLSVLPEFRRQGIQQGLIAARLNLAAERGARIACIGSKPGIGTERNVRRMGFDLGYVKLAMARAGEGLAAIVG